MSKTNFEYLKDICAGNDEALEFIEAAENDYNEISNHFADVSKLQKEQEDILEELIIKVAELEEEPEYPNTINAGIGEIKWKSDNLQLQYVMEALDDKIKSIGALKCMRLLEVRKPVLNS